MPKADEGAIRTDCDVERYPAPGDGKNDHLQVRDSPKVSDINSRSDCNSWLGHLKEKVAARHFDVLESALGYSC